MELLPCWQKQRKPSSWSTQMPWTQGEESHSFKLCWQSGPANPRGHSHLNLGNVEFGILKKPNYVLEHLLSLILLEVAGVCYARSSVDTLRLAAGISFCLTIFSGVAIRAQALVRMTIMALRQVHANAVVSTRRWRASIDFLTMRSNVSVTTVALVPLLMCLF